MFPAFRSNPKADYVNWPSYVRSRACLILAQALDCPQVRETSSSVSTPCLSLASQRCGFWGKAIITADSTRISAQALRTGGGSMTHPPGN